VEDISQSSTAILKRIIFSNFDKTIKEPQSNSFSIRVIYFWTILQQSINYKKESKLIQQGNQHCPLFILVVISFYLEALFPIIIAAMANAPSFNNCG